MSNNYILERLTVSLLCCNMCTIKQRLVMMDAPQLSCNIARPVCSGYDVMSINLLDIWSTEQPFADRSWYNSLLRWTIDWKAILGVGISTQLRSACEAQRGFFCVVRRSRKLADRECWISNHLGTHMAEGQGLTDFILEN